MLKAIGFKVLVVLDEAVKQDDTPKMKYEKQTAGDKICYGTIVSCGSKVTEVKKGDRVYVGKFTPEEQTISGKKYLVLKEDDIIAVL